jgi:hypothetical protein
MLLYESTCILRPSLSCSLTFLLFQTIKRQKENEPKKRLRLRKAPSCKRHLHLLIPVVLPGVLCVLRSHTHSAVTPNLSFNDAVKFF